MGASLELAERIKKEEKKIREQMVLEEKEKAVKKIVKNAIKDLTLHRFLLVVVLYSSCSRKSLTSLNF